MKFKIIIPSYNNENFVEYNIASILNQTYKNWEVLYIDDASTDNTFHKVLSVIGEDNRFTVIKREENKGAAYNYFFELENYLNNDEDIIVHLDGDDWLIDDDVLQNILNFYNKHEIWMTYGKFYCYDGTNSAIEGYPQNTSYSNYVKKYKLYRKDTWRASHLRTYKTFLFKAIDKKDLYSKLDGKLFWHALDLAFQYPYMEMCSPDKIGVVDFPTCVYNQTPKNKERTREREHIDNSKFEDEIRNKKIYQSGLSGKKLNQINVFGDYQERHSIPTKFSYCYNRSYGDFDAILLQDDQILKYINGTIPTSNCVKIIAKVCENKKFFNQTNVINELKSNWNAFDLILTWQSELLKFPNAKFCPITDASQFNLLPESELLLPNLGDESLVKSKLVSIVSSNKKMFEGHLKRLEFLDSIKDKVEVFGRGINEIKSKLEALGPYAFSIAIENDIEVNYFTEKLVDCFRTFTIPIYYGCPNVSDFFDINGIITFNSIEELIDIVDNLSFDKYYNCMNSIKNNFEKSKLYPSDNDSMFDLYYKQLLDN